MQLSPMDSANYSLNYSSTNLDSSMKFIFLYFYSILSLHYAFLRVTLLFLFFSIIVIAILELFSELKKTNSSFCLFWVIISFQKLLLTVFFWLKLNHSILIFINSPFTIITVIFVMVDTFHYLGNCFFWRSF